MEHKSEENGKVLIFLAGNSTFRRQESSCDDVKSKQEVEVVTIQRNRYGVKLGRHGQDMVTAYN